MDFRIIASTVRSVTIEMINSSRWLAPQKQVILLNGRKAAETDRNVVSLFGLLPDTEYQLQVGSTEHSFVTKHESVLLDVKKFGAAGDGSQDDTAFLNAAAAACPKDGTVLVPAGIYRTGPIFLKSDMTFLLEKGAVLLGETDRRKIPHLPGMVRGTDEKSEIEFSSWEGNPLSSFASLITAIDAENLDVIGEGVLDGNAQNSDWWLNPRVKRTAWRPNTVFLERCRNVRLQGLSVRNSPSWTIHPYYSGNLQFLNLDIWNPPDSPNTDGFDPESCDHVLLAGTRISVGDDCVAIKSGKIYMALNHRRRSEDIEIRNCFFSRGHGSVTIGSEIAGGVENVRVSQCVFDTTDRGIRIKTRRGRGKASVLNGLVFGNIVMRNIPMAVTVNMFYFCDPDGHSAYVQNQEPEPMDDGTPSVSSISISDIDCTGADACFMCAYGLPESPIGRISVRNVRAVFRPEAERTPRCPIMMDNFPELSGEAFYLRNIREVELENVTVENAASDRPRMENVESCRIENTVIRTSSCSP